MRNEKGRVWYGLHFYPGVAEYREHGQEPYRVFLNEATLRKMDQTFPGRPVYVLHTDEDLKSKSVDEMREHADGWVTESFYNQADGKHWVKFITVSSEADERIKQGWTLSNAYFMKDSTRGGQWNGVDYHREITDAEFEHLAIVPNPRYEESIILTPEQFKTYNEEKLAELKRLTNMKKEPDRMKFKFFERKKIENNADIENLVVVLPQSKKEIGVSEALDKLDGLLMKNADKPITDASIKIDDEETLTVGELKSRYIALKNELAEIENEKSCNEDDDEDDDEESMENMEDDEEAKKAALKLAEHEEEEIAEKKKNKKKNSADRQRTIEEQKKREKDRLKAEKLRNANKTKQEEEKRVPYTTGLERGKARYGS